MSRRSWVTSSLARRPEIFCWVFVGRTPRSLMLFVGHTPVSSVNRRTSLRRSRQNSSSSRPWLLLRAVLRARDPRDAGQPGEDRVAELVLQRCPHAGGDGLQALLA